MFFLTSLCKVWTLLVSICFLCLTLGLSDSSPIAFLKIINALNTSQDSGVYYSSCLECYSTPQSSRAELKPK